MIRHLDDYPEMKRMLQEILFQGKAFSFNPDTKEISLASMFGYVVNRGGKVQVANRIFETRRYNFYLRPIINGTGNYYIEAQTRDERRTDVIVDCLGEQFVIELKIWRGNEYNERGERQLGDYLDYYHMDKGYLLSFNFNLKKEVGVKEIRVGDKVIVEAVV